MELKTWEQALPKEGVVIILGHRRMGKSGLGWRLVEQVSRKGVRKTAVAFGIPRSRRKLVPDWVRHTDDLKRIPEKSVLLIDEASLRFSARRSMSDPNLLLVALMGLSGQKHQLIIFISHNSRLLDVETIMDSDLVVYKLPSEAHILFERRETAAFTQEARTKLLEKRDPRKWSYVINFHNGKRLLLPNRLPSFWTEKLSTIWAGLDIMSIARTKKKRKGGKR